AAVTSACSWAPRRCETTGRWSWRRCWTTRPPPARLGCRADERAVDLQQRLALAAGEVRVRADRGLDGARAVVLLGSEPGLLVQRVGRAVERRGDRIEHALGRLAQPALDLRQVRIRDPGEVRELAHAQLAQLPLA